MPNEQILVLTILFVVLAASSLLVVGAQRNLINRLSDENRILRRMAER